MKKVYLFVSLLSLTYAANSQNVGIGTNDPKSKLDINGGLSLREGPVLTLVNGGASGGANDNVVLPDISSGVKAGFYRITGPTAAFSVFGIVPAAGADGQLVTLVNTTSNVMTIKNNASSQAANSFKTLTGSDMVSVAGSSSITIQYNKTDSRWYVTGSQNYVVTTGSISTGDITTSNNAIVMSNNTGRLVGTSTMTLDVKTNDLNQKGIVPGPTGGNNNQVWGTDNSGYPAWQKVNNTMLTNNSVTVNPGTGLSGGGNVALGGTITLNNTGDLSTTNEGSLTVGAGTGTTSIISSNTSGSTDVTLEAGANVTLTETGNKITIASSNPGGTVTSVGTGTGLTGGPITTSGTISLANTAVTPGSYTNTNITVDAQGRITAASNGTGGTVTGVTASNGLNSSGGTTPDIKLGGTLSAGTTVALGGNNLMFTGTGNVGVGTGSPGTNLSVAGTLGVSEAGSTGNRLQISSSGSGAVIFQNDNSPIIFKTATATQEKMRIQDNGNVGIGNAAPSQKLDVNGNINATHLLQGPLVARPLCTWSAGGTSNGAIIIKLPGTVANYGMVHMQIDVYEYDVPGVSTYIIGGHNWNGQWYNYSCHTIGSSTKKIRLAIKNNQYCVVLGEYGSSWSYGSVALTKITDGGYYSGIMDLGGTYTAVQDNNPESYTWITGDLNKPVSEGTGTANYVTKWTGANTLGTGAMYDDGTNVGIGTTSPGAPFHIRRSSSANYFTLENTDGSGSGAYSEMRLLSGSRSGYLWVRNQTGGGEGDGAFNVYAETGDLDLWAGGTRHVTIKAGGNVGIGNTSPVAKLQVSGGGAILGTNGTSSNTRTLTILNDGQAQVNFGSYPGNWSPALQIQNNDNSRYLWISPLDAGSGANAKFLANGTGLDFFVGSNSNAVTITPAGNMGVGTTSPGFKLHVPSGYIGTDYINTTDNAVTSGVSGIMVKAGDNYHRTADAASVRAFLGITAPTGDNLGNHSATTTLSMNSNVISSFSRLDPTTGNSPNGGYNHYSIYEEPGTWAFPYPDLMIEYHTGIKYVAYNGYGGHRFYVGYTPDASPTTQAMSIGDGDNNVRINYDLSTVGDIISNQNYGKGLVGVYASDRYQNVFAMGTAYRLAADGSSPGNLYGLAWTHTNVGGQSKPGLSHQLLVMNNGTTQTAIGTGIWTAGNITSVGDIVSDQNYGMGLVGVYSSTRYQNVFAMGSAYRLAADGSTPGNLYGLAWTHTNVGGQSKSGLSHQLLVMENGVTKVALGTGIWMQGNLTFNDANPTISASSYFVAPGGAYFNSGTVYTEAQYQCRGGIHNDNGGYLTLAGGNSADVGTKVNNNVFYVDYNRGGLIGIPDQTNAGAMAVCGNMTGGDAEVDILNASPVVGSDRGFRFWNRSSSGANTEILRLRANNNMIAIGYSTFSDRNLKTDIQPLSGELANKIYALKTYTYQYDKTAMANARLAHDDKTHFGVMAQELEELYPNLVETDTKGIKSVNYMELIPVLLETLKEQNKRIEVLEKAAKNK